MENLKLILGITDDTYDALLALVYEDAENAVCNYCHTRAVPTKLESIVPFIAAEFYKLRGLGGADRGVKSLLQGEREVVFETEEEVLNSYKDRMKAYRRGFVPSSLSEMSDVL